MQGQDLKVLRQAHGLTQQALAALLGYHPNYIYRLESGQEPITSRCEKLIRILLRPKKAMPTSEIP